MTIMCIMFFIFRQDELLPRVLAGSQILRSSVFVCCLIIYG